MYYLPFLLSALLLFPMLSRAQAIEDPEAEEPPRWYQIEVLLFRNLGADAQQEEQWPMEIELQMPELSYRMPEQAFDDSPQPLEVWYAPEPEPEADVTDDTLDEDPLASEPEPLREEDEPDTPRVRGVSTADGHLSAIRNRLERRGDFEVLDYRAWRQPLAQDAEPIYYRVAAGQHHGDYRELEGFIGFYLKRYLHVDTELWWGEYPLAEPQAYETSPEPYPAAEAVSAGQTGTGDDAEGSPEPLLEPETFHYRRVLRAAHLQEKRRMRSDEVHYFDHPLLGVLVRISPWLEGEEIVSAAAD